MTWGGREAQRLTALTLATYGTVCHLCRHGGADSADHLVPRSHGGPDSLDNLRPAHHRRCRVCGLRCNTKRGARPLTAALRAEFARPHAESGRSSFWSG